jgi:hypothetical protein
MASGRKQNPRKSFGGCFNNEQINFCGWKRMIKNDCFFLNYFPKNLKKSLEEESVGKEEG